MFDDVPARQQLLTDETPLTTGYHPEAPIGRATEVEQVAEAVRPITRRKPPTNLIIHGPAGVGKTTVVNHVLTRLNEETRVTAAFINCWQYSTRPALLAELLIALGYPAPRKGKPVDALLAKVREWLEKHTGAVVALDEVDQLDHLTEVVYDLRDASDQAGTAFGMVLLSNHPPSAFQLNNRSRSRLQYDAIEFPPYSKTELLKILRQRADQAFRRDALGDTVLDTVAATVADRGGDCREALALLLQAGRRAEQEHAEKLTVDHVKLQLELLPADRD